MPTEAVYVSVASSYAWLLDWSEGAARHALGLSGLLSKFEMFWTLPDSLPAPLFHSSFLLVLLLLRFSISSQGGWIVFFKVLLGNFGMVVLLSF